MMSTQSNRRPRHSRRLPNIRRSDPGFRPGRVSVQTALVVMGGIVGIVAGLQGLLGAFISSDRVAVTVAFLLVATGALFIVAIANDWHRWVPQRAVVITIAVIAPLALGVGLGVAASSLLNPASDPPASSPRAGSTVPAGSTFSEVAANRRGTPVFRDPQGAAVPLHVPASIPYLTKVQVRCKVRNTSAITSVSYWYQLADHPWRGMYAPSDTFANGDPIGTIGTHNVDTKVPDC
jgi:hypothetical protein